MMFSDKSNRTGRKAQPATVKRSAPAAVRNARAASITVKGHSLMPASLRNSDHGDIDMFKNHLDHYLSNIPDQPTIPGMGRAAASNSLIHQVPLYEASF